MGLVHALRLASSRMRTRAYGLVQVRRSNSALVIPCSPMVSYFAGPPIRSERRHVKVGHGVPLRMSGDDKGPGLECPARQLRTRLLKRRGSEIERQSDGEDMPGRSQLHTILRRMQLCPENRREGPRAKRPGVDERPSVVLQEVLGQRQEVVPRRLVEAADLLRRTVAVRKRRVCAGCPARSGRAGKMASPQASPEYPDGSFSARTDPGRRQRQPEPRIRNAHATPRLAKESAIRRPSVARRYMNPGLSSPVVKPNGGSRAGTCHEAALPLCRSQVDEVLVLRS
jgi:hypothetical protein